MKKLLLMLFITLPALTACWDGDTGNTGANGPQGIQGDQGVPGEQGIQGVAGIQGPNGLACWDLNEDGLQTFADDPDDETVISEDINGDNEITVVDCTGLNGDAGSDCRMGVFVTGAYLLQLVDDDADGTLLHTTMLIVDTTTEVFAITGARHGIVVLDTKIGVSVTFFRGDDGLLPSRFVGSCLTPPPVTGVT